LIGRSSAPGVKSAKADVGDSNELNVSFEHGGDEGGDSPDVASIDKAGRSEASTKLVEVSQVSGFAVEKHSTDDFTPLISRRIIRDMRSGEQVVDY
jgi:hypothetical protein